MAAGELASRVVIVGVEVENPQRERASNKACKTIDQEADRLRITPQMVAEVHWSSLEGTGNGGSKVNSERNFLFFGRNEVDRPRKLYHQGHRRSPEIAGGSEREGKHWCRRFGRKKEVW